MYLKICKKLYCAVAPYRGYLFLNAFYYITVIITIQTITNKYNNKNIGPLVGEQVYCIFLIIKEIVRKLPL